MTTFILHSAKALPVNPDGSTDFVCHLRIALDGDPPPPIVLRGETWSGTVPVDGHPVVLPAGAHDAKAFAAHVNHRLGRAAASVVEGGVRVVLTRHAYAGDGVLLNVPAGGSLMDAIQAQVAHEEEINRSIPQPPIDVELGVEFEAVATATPPQGSKRLADSARKKR